MNARKSSLQPPLSISLLSVAGLMTNPLQDALLNLFGKKNAAVMTCLPGPPAKLTLCRATLEQNMFGLPQTGSMGMGMGVSIPSCSGGSGSGGGGGGGVQSGVIADIGLCPEPRRIVDTFTPEFERLRMLPWEDDTPPRSTAARVAAPRGG
jgi:diacylglycerol O-acyltransferase